MNDQNSEPNQNKTNFIYPHSTYRGHFTPENLVFNANLQEFAQKVSYICNLETSGKVSPQEAYRRIKNLWQELKDSIQNLGIEEK